MCKYYPWEIDNFYFKMNTVGTHIFCILEKNSAQESSEVSHNHLNAPIT